MKGYDCVAPTAHLNFLEAAERRGVRGGRLDANIVMGWLWTEASLAHDPLTAPVHSGNESP